MITFTLIISDKNISDVEYFSLHYFKKLIMLVYLIIEDTESDHLLRSDWRASSLSFPFVISRKHRDYVNILFSNKLFLPCGFSIHWLSLPESIKMVVAKW